MFAHASGGPLLFTNKWFQFNRLAAKSLQRKGIAVMFIDNFAPRGTYTTHANQQKVPHWSTFIDTFMALEYVSKDPKININNYELLSDKQIKQIELRISEAVQKNIRDILSESINLEKPVLDNLKVLDKEKQNTEKDDNTAEKRPYHRLDFSEKPRQRSS